MLHPDLKTDRNKTSNAISDIWDLLPLFWDKDRVKKWRNTIFPNGIGVEGCFNLISLSPDAHDMWNRGAFALKPLNLSRDRKKLTVQFFWQVPGNYKNDDRIDLLTEPTSSVGLEIVANGQFLSHLEDDGSDPRIRPIQSGELFTFATEDPKSLPLPSAELLEMQWILQRLVGMCGAAGWPSLDEDDDNWLNPDYTYSNVHNSLKRVREWVGTEDATGITPETPTAAPGPSMIQCY
jgi:hypothetical protein